MALSLLNNASATGAPVRWPGGRGEFSAAGTFGGAAVSLQAQLPDGTYADVGTYTTLVSAGRGGFEIGPAMVRCAISGGGASGMFAQVNLTQPAPAPQQTF